MKLRTFLLLLALLPWAGLHAQQTAVMRVSVTVEETCDVAVPDVALDPARRVAPQRPVLSATCSPDATYFLGLNKGRLLTAAAIQRKTESAVHAPALTGVGTGEPVDHTLFGGMPASQLVPPGSEGETVSVRVYY